MDSDAIRLTDFSHGGGCGCKIAPALLSEILSTLPRPTDDALIVGAEDSDDAAVYRIDDRQALVATTDFFMPIVDDPFDFGRIAAVNALSDVYAVGGRPVLALAVVGMPIGKLPVDVIRRILEGGQATCQTAGISVAGGHSIDAPEPIYGLAAVGLIDPRHVKRNGDAQAGDILILGKALGVGVLSAALKKEQLDKDGYAEMLATTTQLNDIGMELAKVSGVHAMTDVTGFGLLGHLIEVCRASRLAARLVEAHLPVLPTAKRLAKGGLSTGAAARNWASYGTEIDLSAALPAWRKDLLCDPQTSGGLLISCAPGEAEAVLRLFHERGYGAATVIGTMVKGSPRIAVD